MSLHDDHLKPETYRHTGKEKTTYVFLSKEVLHLLLSRLTEGVGLEGGEAVVYGQVHLSHSEERAEGNSGLVHVFR